MGSPDFHMQVIDAIRDRFGVFVEALQRPKRQSQNSPRGVKSIQLTYTRDNRAYRDIAIDHIRNYFAMNGVGISVNGGTSRPHSDSFEDSLPFFNSKLLPPMTDSSMMETKSESAATPIKQIENGNVAGRYSAWDNIKSVRRSSLTDEQRDRLLSDLPEYLRQTGISNNRAGDVESSPSSFSRAVGTRPRSDGSTNSYASLSSKRFSGESGNYSSNSSLFEQPISRPSTSGGKSDTWGTVNSSIRQDSEPRKSIQSLFSPPEKRHGML